MTTSQRTIPLHNISSVGDELAPTCPYLGLIDDPGSNALYPRNDHICRVPGAEAPSPDWQGRFCLQGTHEACRYYAPAVATLPIQSASTSVNLEGADNFNPWRFRLRYYAERWGLPSSHYTIPFIIAGVALLLVGMATVLAMTTSGGDDSNTGDATNVDTASTENNALVVVGDATETPGSDTSGAVKVPDSLTQSVPIVGSLDQTPLASSTAIVATTTTSSATGTATTTPGQATSTVVGETATAVATGTPTVETPAQPGATATATATNPPPAPPTATTATIPANPTATRTPTPRPPTATPTQPAPAPTATATPPRPTATPTAPRPTATPTIAPPTATPPTPPPTATPTTPPATMTPTPGWTPLPSPTP